MCVLCKIIDVILKDGIRDELWAAPHRTTTTSMNKLQFHLHVRNRINCCASWYRAVSYSSVIDATCMMTMIPHVQYGVAVWEVKGTMVVRSSTSGIPKPAKACVSTAVEPLSWHKHHKWQYDLICLPKAINPGHRASWWWACSTSGSTSTRTPSIMSIQICFLSCLGKINTWCRSESCLMVV